MASREGLKQKAWRRWVAWVGCVIWVIGLGWLGISLWTQTGHSGDQILYRGRNFYGVLTLFKREESGVPYLQLMHGRIQHGLQLLDPAQASWPTAYFSEGSGVGLAMNALTPGGRRIGVIGLGAGTLAAYCQAGDTMRFYEIDPEVLRLAKSPFSYLSQCKGKVDVLLGDARLTLEREAPQNFDLFVLDAFSSDAIPVHLLTAEVFGLYERHLKTNGLFAFHISNGRLNLEPVVANLARQFNYRWAIIDYDPPREQWWNQKSVWVLLSRNEELMNSPVICESSRPALAASAPVPLWTDDFASLFQVIRWAPAPHLDPHPAEAELEIAVRLMAKGDYKGAVSRYQRALSIDPYLVEALNNLAWLLATCPDSSLRNGTEAVQYAEKACEMTHHRRVVFLGTLAAAYAEAGLFPKAVATAQEACDLASILNEDALLTRNRELLELYRSGKAYREEKQ